MRDFILLQLSKYNQVRGNGTLAKPNWGYKSLPIDNKEIKALVTIHIRFALCEQKTET